MLSKQFLVCKICGAKLTLGQDSFFISFEVIKCSCFDSHNLLLSGSRSEFALSSVDYIIFHVLSLSCWPSYFSLRNHMLFLHVRIVINSVLTSNVDIYHLRGFMTHELLILNHSLRSSIRSLLFHLFIFVI